MDEYTLKHYKPDTQRVSVSVFKGNVTGVYIGGVGHVAPFDIA